MTEAAKKALHAVDSLPEPERSQVVLEILRRAALEEHDTPSDAGFTAAADDLFLELDRRETE